MLCLSVDPNTVQYLKGLKYICTGELKKGDTVLIHAGGSGVGTAAVQLSTLAGAKPIITAGSEAKINTAKHLGALAGFNYKEGDFSEKVLEYTDGKKFQNPGNLIKLFFENHVCFY